ncbi:MAG: helix-turn-helix transcriptional regulator [Actinobacteria bacterium]|nr:helix-turn-helix transcriptional regulator [Actinomycetota bacterium]
MQWNLRLRAAERGIWKSAQLRRMLTDAGLEISAGKMSSWWAGTPPTMRLEELDVLCALLECTPNDLMTPEPDKVADRRPRNADAANGNGNGNGGNGNGDPNDATGKPQTVNPRLGKPRSTPPL